MPYKKFSLIYAVMSRFDIIKSHTQKSKIILLYHQYIFRSFLLLKMTICDPIIDNCSKCTAIG